MMRYYARHSVLYLTVSISLPPGQLALGRSKHNFLQRISGVPWVPSWSRIWFRLLILDTLRSLPASYSFHIPVYASAFGFLWNHTLSCSSIFLGSSRPQGWELCEAIHVSRTYPNSAGLLPNADPLSIDNSLLEGNLSHLLMDFLR